MVSRVSFPVNAHSQSNELDPRMRECVDVRMCAFFSFRFVVSFISFHRWPHVRNDTGFTKE